MSGEEPIRRGLRVGCITDRGQVREENQDACFSDIEQGLLIVADGMGGRNAGSSASKAAVDMLPRLLKERQEILDSGEPDAIEQALLETIVELSERLRDLGSQRLETTGMGSTIVVVMVRGGQAYVSNMGDSHAFLMRHGAVERLSEDQSVVAMLLEAGVLTEEEARAHPSRGSLACFAGMEITGKPATRRVTLERGDCLLLCTDGLTRAVSKETITELLRRHEGAPPRASVALVKAANEAGGEDNITVLIAEWLGAP